MKLLYNTNFNIIPNNISNTSVLMHFDESTTLDECGNSWNVYRNNVSLTSTNAKFGKALYCTSGHGLTNSNSLFNLYSTDLTIECWCVLASAGARSSIISIFNKYSDVGFHIQGYYENNKTLFINPDICTTNGSIINFNHWNKLIHIAYTYKLNEGKHSFFLNGEHIWDEYIMMTPKIYSTVRIGTDWNYYPSISTIDELRISSIVRYTSNFIPSTVPFEID